MRLPKIFVRLKNHDWSRLLWNIARCDSRILKDFKTKIGPSARLKKYNIALYQDTSYF